MNDGDDDQFVQALVSDPDAPAYDDETPLYHNPILFHYQWSDRYPDHYRRHGYYGRRYREQLQELITRGSPAVFQLIRERIISPEQVITICSYYGETCDLEKLAGIWDCFSADELLSLLRGYDDVVVEEVLQVMPDTVLVGVYHFGVDDWLAWVFEKEMYGRADQLARALDAGTSLGPVISSLVAQKYYLGVGPVLLSTAAPEPVPSALRFSLSVADAS